MIKNTNNIPTRIDDFKECHYKVLRRLDRHPVKENFSGLMSLELNIPNFIPVLKILGLVEVASYKESLMLTTTDKLKSILSSLNLKATENKTILVQKILNNADEASIRLLDQYSDYYILTEKGKEVVKQSYLKFETENISFFRKEMTLILNRQFDLAYRNACKRNSETYIYYESSRSWTERYQEGIPNTLFKESKHIMRSMKSPVVSAAALYSCYSGDSRINVTNMLIKAFSLSTPYEELSSSLHYISSILSVNLNMQNYKACKTKEYRFVATLDKHTCPICGELDGKTFLVKNRKIGVNCPPMHKGCRCTTEVALPEEILARSIRRARNPITNAPYITSTYINWSEWVNIPFTYENCGSPSLPIVTTSKKEESIKNTQMPSFNPNHQIDDYFELAARCVIKENRASIGLLQMVFKINFNRAEKIMNQLYESKIVGEEDGTKPRKVLITMEEFEYRLENNLISFSNSVDDASNFEESYTEFSEEETKIILKEKLNIDIDYSHDGCELKNLKNIIVPQATSEIQVDFINNLIKLNSPNTLRLILADSSIVNLDIYNPIPHMYVPVVTDLESIPALINQVYSILKIRLSLFLTSHTKDLDSYNAKMIETKESLLPRILFIIDEMYNLPAYVDDNLLQLLLNSNRVGIYLVLFSKFSIKHLGLGIKKDLLDVYDSNQLNNLFYSTKSSQNSNLLSVAFDDMNGYEFENFCADVLAHNRFKDINITPSSGDQGIDIVATKDEIKYGIQCKCYSSDIGNKAVQEAFAGAKFYDCHVAVVLTNRYFTNSAQELAKKNNVLVWDRNYLMSLIKNLSQYSFK